MVLIVASAAAVGVFCAVQWVALTFEITIRRRLG